LILIDTGGVIANSKDEMSGQIYDQVALAIDEADVIVFIVDGKNGMCGADEEVANLLRRSKKPIILAVNKIDDPPDEPKAMEFYGLGLGDPVTLSAMRGSGGVGDVLDRVLEILGLDQPVKKKRKKKEYVDDLPEEEEDDELGPTSIAIVGKPNVGKSSITNLLCGKSRTIVGAEPGTTRDAIDTPIKVNGKDYIVVDTAGIRRRNKVDYGIEAFAVVRSLRALERANVCVLVLDASQEITDQDQKIASKIEEAGKAAVIVLNKWDLIEDKTSRLMNEYTERMKTELRAISYAEVVFTSAVSKQRIPKIIEAVDRAQESTRKRISTGTLNQIVNESVALVPPPASKRGKRLKVYYTTQVSVAPPTFVVFANDNKLMTRQYEVYLERKIRDSFGYVGTPVRIITRSKKDTK
jgi:GTP-binding protein